MPKDTRVEQPPWREPEFIPYEAVTRCPPGPVLVLAPHPDDEVFGCGGAILRHLAAGDSIKVIIATDSDFGSFVTGAEGIAERRREAEAAARVLGYGSPSFWGLPDRGLVYDETLIGRVREAVEQSGAAIVYAPSWWEIHPDHCVLAMATVEALRRCPRTVIMAMYEVGVPLHPNLLLDITDLKARKQEAMTCFQSQLQVQRYDSHIAALNHFRTYTLPAGAEAAEAFRLLRGDDLRQYPLRAIRPGLYYAQSQTTHGIVPPLVSVLFLGGRGDMADALDSVMLQTHAHIEIIVVSDWGLDPAGLAPGLDYWGNSRFPIRVIEASSHCSLAQRANLAMAGAMGDWLLMLGKGDSLLPIHVAQLLDSLAESAPARCGSGGVQMVQMKNGRPLGGREWRLDPSSRQPQAYCALPLSAVMFKRELFMEGCHFNTQLGDLAAIWDFWLQLASRTQWAITSEVTTRHHYLVTARLKSVECAGLSSGAAIPVIQNWLDRGASVELASTIWEGMASLEQTLARNSTLKEQVVSLMEEQKGRIEFENSLHDKLVALGQQFAEQKIITSKVEGKCHELLEQIDALHKSTSWRLTRPLRKLALWLRGLRRA